jgi:hypothetical protein
VRVVTHFQTVARSMSRQTFDLSEIRGHFNVDLIGTEDLGRTHTVVDFGVGVVGFEGSGLERVNRHACVIENASHSLEVAHRGLGTQAS